MAVSTAPSTTLSGAPAKGRWITDWRPNDPAFWESTGKKVARRNLAFSVLAEHVGFAVWSLWSVMVLFLPTALAAKPATLLFGLTPAQKFLLVSVPTLVGAIARIPYTLAVARFGGRNWTIVSAALLVIPLVGLGIVMSPETLANPKEHYGTLLFVAALAGFGGGNFASSMANINALYPEGKKGWALGLNAGAGNLGVAAAQLVGLAVLINAGVHHPRYLVAVYLPLIIIAAAMAALFMDNLATMKNDTRSMREVLRDPHALVMSLLYIGTFGSFIGYSFAFGQVLTVTFAYTPLAAAKVTFIGPLIGSVSRPVGGWLADKVGGAWVTLVTFLSMSVATFLVLRASQEHSKDLFVLGFIVLFTLTGIGNGSTYKMIPAIFRARAGAAGEMAGNSSEAIDLHARRLSGALIGISGAIGALGGVLVNLVFRNSFLHHKNGDVAYSTFIGFYVMCAAVTYAVYLRSSRMRAAGV
jgi:NNP family nitrate/nitrite transporter-like MFS transporter